MSDEANMIMGPYRLEALEDVSIVSRGSAVSISAMGDLGSLVMDASTEATIVCGPAGISVINVDEVQGQVKIAGGELGSVLHLAGPPIGGAQIKLEPEMITISVGPPGAGASIRLTPESITLKVAEVSLTLTPEGIAEEVAEVTREATPEGHMLTAAETTLNVGVAGMLAEGPMKQEEWEGSAVTNATLAETSTEAMSTEEAGIKMIE